MPLELFGLVTSSLTDREISSLAQVSRKIGTQAIDVTKMKQWAEVGAFVDSIGEALPPSVRERLRSLDDTPMRNAQSLKQMKQVMVELRLAMIDILKELREADLDKLSENYKGPSNFKKIFNLAALVKRLDLALANAAPDSLDSLSTRFIRKGGRDILFEKVLRTNHPRRADIFTSIFDSLLEEDKGLEAETLVYRIADPRMREAFLLYICRKQVEVDRNVAEGIAGRIPDVGIRDAAYLALSLKLAKPLYDGEVDDDLEQVEFEDDLEVPEEDDLNFAYRLSSLIVDPEKKGEALRQIVSNIIYSDRPDKWDLAERVAGEIPEGLRGAFRENSFTLLCRHLATNQELDRATHIAYNAIGTRDRGSALSNIAEARIKQGLLDPETERILSEILPHDEDLLTEFALKLSEQGRYAEAIDCAKSIDTDLTRRRALVKIQELLIAANLDGQAQALETLIQEIPEPPPMPYFSLGENPFPPFLIPIPLGAWPMMPEPDQPPTSDSQ